MVLHSTSRILVVDDYEPMRFLKTQVLSKAGFEVIQAASGREALRLVTTARPHLVLLDLNLPDIYGVDVCCEIKSGETTSLPVIYTTADCDTQSFPQSGDGCIVGLKPKEWVNTIQSLLSSPIDREPRRPGDSRGGAAAPEPVAGSSAPTQFAPSERRSVEDVERQARRLESSGLAVDILDKAPLATVVLNDERQIVYCSPSALRLSGGKDRREILGLRPGEALDCIHAAETSGGCGTSEFCRTCGVVRTILEGQLQPSARECRLTRRVEGIEQALDLLVSVSPLNGEEHLSLCSLTDISHQKRRRALERIFFHDILSVAEGLQGLTERIEEILPTPDPEKYGQMLRDSAAQLLAEIGSQRKLLEAENSELALTLSSVSTARIARQVAELYRCHPVARDRAIRVDDGCQDILIRSDEAVLRRVLGDMLKNALEAALPEETATIGCHAVDGGVEFWVHNPGFMEKQIQSQVFQRSFSTKGEGRGLGTYSIKMLSERYLGGTVGFHSTAPGGTRFFARFPKRLGDEPASGGAL
jgi:CheY-like chemotaxis protein